DIIGEDTLDGEVQRLAHDLGQDDAVTFHGFRPSEVVTGFLQQSHLLLHSSRHESGPIVFLEAAACGVPAVGTAVGHFADLAPDSAVAVPVGDPAALARATLDLLHDPARRRAVGESAQAWALTHDADWTAAQFEALYARLVSARL
ncbi:MAG: glycosyltransferase family 4 protein, partial [Anaerolineae bacterium]|nr:glycosyltransferase family 4 protein [Anaerolineae bacterium]